VFSVTPNWLIFWPSQSCDDIGLLAYLLFTRKLYVICIGRTLFGQCDLSVRSFVTGLWRRYFENEWTDFAANWNVGTRVTGMKRWTFGVQEVKRQGQTTPKLDFRFGGCIIIDPSGRVGFTLRILRFLPRDVYA